MVWKMIQDVDGACALAQSVDTSVFSMSMYARRCHFESALSSELLSRLAAYPKMRNVLDELPPKMIRLSSNKPAVSVDFSVDALGARVGDVLERIRS